MEYIIGSAIIAVGGVAAALVYKLVRPQDRNTAPIAVSWGDGTPTEETILGGRIKARESILLLGMSNDKLLHHHPKAYREWLDDDANRVIGVLFLNPHSPHAFRRQRIDVPGAAADKIASALENAQSASWKHDRLRVAVYDGPYRYSARAIDMGRLRSNPRSRIILITSSHAEGLSKGFTVHLKPGVERDAFAHYRKELLNVWKQALANPSGHGVSLVSRWSKPLDEDIGEIEKGIEKLLAPIGADSWKFGSEQLHLTLGSLCRTQTVPEAGPLGLVRVDRHRTLPEHFPEFVSEAVQAALIILPRNSLEFDFDRLALDKEGHVVLHASERPIHLDSLVNQFTKLRKEFAERYPEEGWNSPWVKDGCRFGPKSEHFSPHVTVGMAFAYDSSLPLPLEKKERQVEIPPVKFVGRKMSVVHYAYRSLLRCVGEKELELSDPHDHRTDAAELLRSLRL